MPTIDLSSYKPVQGTDSDANLIDNAFDTIQALLNGELDKNNLAAAAGILASQLAGCPGDVTKALFGDGSWLVPAGHEFAYAEITAPVTVSATSDSGSTTLITLPSVTFDGSTRVFVEFQGISAIPVSPEQAYVSLFDNGTDLGRLWRTTGNASAAAAPSGKRFLTPSAGAHVFTIRGHRDSADWTFGAGTGGAGTDLPAWARVTKA